MDRTGDVLAAMATVRAQFMSAVPEGMANDFWAPQGQPLLAGSTVPAIMTEYVELPSGLLVPRSCATPPQPFDLAFQYLTANDVLGFQPPLEWVEDQLRRIPVEDVLVFAATVLSAVRRPDIARPEIDEGFMEQWLAEPNLTRVRNIMKDRTRAFVVPQMVHVLLKLGLSLSPDAMSSQEAGGWPVHGVLLSLPDLLHDPSSDAGTVITGPADSLTRELAANQMFNASPDVAALVGRAADRWLRLPQAHLEHPRVVDLEALYEESTGVSLRVVMAVALALFASTIGGAPRVAGDYLRPMGLTPEAERAALDLLATDIGTLRDAVREEVSTFGWNWSVNSVGRYPVVRLANGDLLVLDAALLLHRVFGRLPLFDMYKKVSQRQFNQAARALEHLAEEQTINAVMGSIDGNRQNRVFREENLQSVPGRESSKACDAAIDYGDSWVLLEVTTSHLKRESVAGVAGSHLDDDLDKLVRKAEQLHESIETLRVGQQHLTGVPSSPTTRYMPVLVLAEGFPVNPTTLTLVRERVHNAGWLTAPDVAPLELVDMEDMEVVEALAEQEGPSLLEVLRSKQKHDLRNVGLKEFVLLGLRLHPKRPQRLDASFLRAFDDVVRRLATGTAEGDAASAGAA